MSAPRYRNAALFVIFGFMLGAAAGAAVWAVLKVMSLGIFFLWTRLPELTGAESGYAKVIYYFSVYLAGGAVIGLFQKKYGILPETLETVMGRLKRDGTYPYDKLHILTIAALLPLIFGGCLGPEAGLTGIIVGLCCWAGDKLKYKGRQVRELAEAGMAATLGVIFNAPFYGLANNIEHGDTDPGDSDTEKNDEDDGVSAARMKKAKAAVYVAGVAGGFLTMGLLSHFFGGGFGLARFTADMDISLHNWVWFPLAAVSGIAIGVLYRVVEKATGTIAAKIAEHRVASCIIVGGCLASLGLVFPWAMFSGEEQLGDLMDQWRSIPATVLILTVFVKVLLVNVCLSFGWRGGNIFPVIFSGAACGYAVTALTGIDPLFGTAVCAAAVCGYMMRKPVTAAAILFLCFPMRAFIPLAAAAFIGSLIPVPWAKPQKTGKEKHRQSKK